MNENIDKLNDQELETVAGGTITQDQALAEALKAAGLKKEQLDFIKKIQPDFEHGRQVFEIEFYHGGFEYEFDIDAADGKVLKYKKDWD